MNAYLIVIGKEPKARNYSAFSSDVPGCATVGDTIENTLLHMHDALRFHLNGIIEDGNDIPRPQSLENHLNESPELCSESLIFAQIPLSKVMPKTAHLAYA